MKRSSKIVVSVRAGLSLAVGLGQVTLSSRAVAAAAVPPAARATLNHLPFCFEANHGQTDAAFPFLARGRGCNFFVSPHQAILTLTRFDAAAETTRDERAEKPGGRITVTHQLRFDFPGANPAAQLSGTGEMPGKANYFLGNDPTRWGAGASLFQQVRVAQLYPGVDLVYYGNDRRLEYDFVIAPHTDPAAIAIRFTGADQIKIDAQGNLVFALGERELSQPKPVVYQTVNGVRQEIAGSYQLNQAQTVSFKLGDYDHALPLVIDPILSYSRFFGGTGADTGWDLAIHKEGTREYVYVAGETMSAGLPVTAGTNYSGGTSFGGDAFVAKFDLSSTSPNPAYFTYLGGKAEDAALAIAVDADGNAYVTGYTTSTNFPTLNPMANQASLHGTPHPTLDVYPPDAFLAKLYSTGTLAFASFLGGSTNDVAIGIAVNAARDIFLTGYTRSTDFPTNNALYGRLGSTNFDDAFVTRLTSASNSYTIVYSTYLGGTNVDHGEGIAADDAGNAYVTGYTSSTNFPITGSALHKFLNNPATNATNHVVGTVIGHDTFITKLSPDGQTNLFTTFLGGGYNDEGYRITLDAQTNFYICGASFSADFPVTAANFPRGVTNSILYTDAFVAKFDASSNSNCYTVQFGGSNTDQAWDVSVDANGFAHVVGVSYSGNFPTTNTLAYLPATNAGFADVFVTVLDPTGTNMVRSLLFGGALNDFGYAIKTDAAGNDYVVGLTDSTNFPTLAPFNSTFGGANDVFLAKLLPESRPTLNLVKLPESVTLTWPVYWPDFKPEAVLSFTSTNQWENLLDFFPVIKTNGQFSLTIFNPVDRAFFRLRR